jgi:uncharacterized protein (UPF0371 family)
MRMSTRVIIAIMMVPATLAVVLLMAASDGMFDKSRNQATTDLMKIDREKAHEFLSDNPRPDEERWIVLNRVYEVWLNHKSGTSELEQLQRVILSLTSQGYKVNSVSITSFAPHQKRNDGSDDVLTWQMPNTALITVEK